jgi:hypothetical protein
MIDTVPSIDFSDIPGTLKPYIRLEYPGVYIEYSRLKTEPRSSLINTEMKIKK